MLQSLLARVVFPVESRPIEHGVVTIDNDRIVAVGRPADGPVRDLGDVALLPGLVNAHTHLEFSDLKQPLGRPGIPFADWLRLVIAERRRDRVVSESIAAGINESIACGVTAIGEIATADAAAYASCPLVDLTLLVEAIGFAPARAASVLAVVTERLDAIQTLADRNANIRLGLSPHAPYSVSPALLDQLIAMARLRGLPVAMHLAESVDEVELLATGQGSHRELLDELSMWEASTIPRGTRLLDYLRRLADAPRALVVHGNYLDNDELAFLANHADRMSLVYCPRTHAYFRHVPYPLAESLAAGVRVVLGTDSRASSPDLNLLAEMRQAARSHPHVDPQTILRMATFWAAEALGRADQLGSIAPGKVANLVAIPLPAGITGAPDDILAAILAADNAPSGTWLRGRQVHGGVG
jgi:cytosine/adenosine deaminase-related metal-dependent hydrolase